MVNLSSIICAVLGGLVSSLALWFTFARTLVTRKEMEDAIEKALAPLDSRQEKSDGIIENLRDEMGRLREAVVRLTTLLEQLTK